MANRAYRYRLYPDKEQTEQIIKTAGCCRYIYNAFLDKRITAYKETGKMPGCSELCRELVPLKKELPWLKEADSIALQQAVRDLDTAYENFFAGRARFPKFKSKRRSGCSYRTVCVNGNVRVEDDRIILPKLGRVRAAVSRKAPEGWRLTSATVSADRDGTYHVSCLYEYGMSRGNSGTRRKAPAAGRNSSAGSRRSTGTSQTRERTSCTRNHC